MIRLFFVAFASIYGREEDEPQMLSFESMAESEITDKLSKTDINTLTPLEALNLVYELKKMIP